MFQQEASDDDDDNIYPLRNGDIVPTKFDILLGRDKASYSHCGNKRFRVIVAINRERYQSCRDRQEKTQITAEIISNIRECGGRFLKRNNKTGHFEEADNDVAHEKVSHALRSAKDPAKKAPRKKRKVVYRPPTEQENRAFEFLYKEQQTIFQQLLAKHTAEEEEEKEHVIVGV